MWRFRHSYCCKATPRHYQPRVGCLRMAEALVSIVVFQAQPALTHALLLYNKALPPGKASTRLKERFHPFPRAEEFKTATSPLAFVDRHFTSVAHAAAGDAIATIDHHAIRYRPLRMRAGQCAHHRAPRLPPHFPASQWLIPPWLTCC